MVPHNFGTRWRPVVNLMYRALKHRVKKPRYTFETKLREPHSWAVLCEKMKNLLYLPEMQQPFLDLPVRNLVAKPASPPGSFTSIRHAPDAVPTV
jgi:hypothetical protein